MSTPDEVRRSLAERLGVEESRVAWWPSRLGYQLVVDDIVVATASFPDYHRWLGWDADEVEYIARLHLRRREDGGRINS